MSSIRPCPASPKPIACWLARPSRDRRKDWEACRECWGAPDPSAAAPRCAKQRGAFVATCVRRGDGSRHHVRVRARVLGHDDVIRRRAARTLRQTPPAVSRSAARQHWGPARPNTLCTLPNLSSYLSTVALASRRLVWGRRDTDEWMTLMENSSSPLTPGLACCPYCKVHHHWAIDPIV